SYWAWLHSHQPTHNHISLPIRRDVPGLVCGLSTRQLFLRYVRPHTISHITPHTTGRTRPRMGPVNTPATPTTRATSHLAWLHSHQPTQSYITPHTTGCTRPRMGPVNKPTTPTTRATSHWAWLHSHQPTQSYITPHTTGRTRPRMGPVNTPATPTTRATSHNITSLPIRRDVPGLVWGLSTQSQKGIRGVVHQHIINSGPSNGPNLANPENTRYAISVRDSNDIRIEIRAHLRARDIERITLGQKCPSTTVPTRHPRVGTAWVSKAIIHRRKISKSRATL
ncbi:unnamed protein product, partial [Prunus brigantina]